MKSLLKQIAPVHPKGAFLQIPEIHTCSPNPQIIKHFPNTTRFRYVLRMFLVRFSFWICWEGCFKSLQAPLFEGLVVRTAFKLHCSRDLGAWQAFKPHCSRNLRFGLPCTVPFANPNNPDRYPALPSTKNNPKRYAFGTFSQRFGMWLSFWNCGEGKAFEKPLNQTVGGGRLQRGFTSALNTN